MTLQKNIYIMYRRIYVIKYDNMEKMLLTNNEKNIHCFISNSSVIDITQIRQVKMK